MGAPKYASLRPELLARKGEAEPSARQPDTHDLPIVPKIGVSNLGVVEVKHDSAEKKPPTDHDREERPAATGVRASIRLQARHKALLVFLKTVHGTPHGDVIDAALETYMNDLAQGEMRECRCFLKVFRSGAA